MGEAAIPIIQGLLTSAAVSTIFAPDIPKSPPLPGAEPEIEMPMVDDDAAQKARRKSRTRQRQRHGRASTIFTEGQGLGG